ncbi:MAG: hypothetical protein N2578_06065 [Bdellovibrionaceae bacterium]|nr:hypothetical protein [Pseudobdellovibrionaceae bacterium]
MSYEDLLKEINRSKNRITRRSEDPFQSVKLHTGFGYVNSFKTLLLGQGRQTRFHSGVELSLGVDLFSEEWYAEGAIRNYGLSRQGAEEILSRQIDLKFGHKSELAAPWAVRLEAGLSNHTLRVTDDHKGLITDELSPSLLVSGELSAQINKFISFGLEASGRNPILQRGIDRGSIDFMMSLKASL